MSGMEFDLDLNVCGMSFLTCFNPDPIPNFFRLFTQNFKSRDKMTEYHPTVDDPNDTRYQRQQKLILEGKKFFFDAEKLPGVNIESLLEVFESVDLDSNGYLDAQELRHILTLLGERPSDEEIDEMIRMVDVDGMGQVGLEEFMRLFEAQNIVSEMQNVKMGSDKVRKEIEEAIKKQTEESKAGALAATQKRAKARDKMEKEQAKDARKADKGDTEQNYQLLKQFGVAPAMLKKYYERFLEVDRDESGSINYEEFCLVLEEDDSDVVRALFDIFDLDHSGTIEMKEFIVGLSAYCSTTTKEERLKFAFMICDSENTGYLGKADIGRILKANFLAQQASDKDIDRRVAKVFKSAGAKDEISFQEFIDVSKKVSGLVFPAYALMDEAGGQTK